MQRPRESHKIAAAVQSLVAMVAFMSATDVAASARLARGGDSGETLSSRVTAVSTRLHKIHSKQLRAMLSPEARIAQWRN
jgi:hypothetical protein